MADNQVAKLRRYCVAVLALLVLAKPALAVDSYVYPGVAREDPAFLTTTPGQTGFDRDRDIKAILKMALEKTSRQYGPYELRASDVPMTEARYMEELRENRAVNITWSSTSVQKEKDFLPVRVDLRKGLLGYRICLIHKDKQAELRKVKTLQQLRQLTVGQGIGWGDVDIYRFNGIKVVTANYDNLFAMIDQSRIDLFPRGITEIFGEYDAASKQDKNLAIDDSLLIYYPSFPYYFFFNTKDTRLAQRVEDGLHFMMADGSFDRIFWQYNRGMVKRARLEKRTVITLQNPLIQVPIPTSP